MANRPQPATEKAAALVRKGWSVARAAKKHGLHIATVYRALRRAGK